MDTHKMNVQFDESANRVDAPPDRSRSRGREVKSSGRGGAGNIRSSVERDSRTYIDSVPVRDREHSPLPGGVIFTGRGGVGNIRTPTHEDKPVVQHDDKEDALLRAAAEKHHSNIHSSGRGGVGNLLRTHSAADNHVSGGPIEEGGRSESGSRSRSRIGRMVGRGGAGNFSKDVDGQVADASMDEEDIEARRAHAEAARGRERDAPHSTGRGGAANFTTSESPAPEAVLMHQDHVGESSGRGGAGNIFRGGRRPSAGPRSPSVEFSTGIPTLDRDGQAIGSRAVDSRGGARSSSRETGRGSREHSVEKLWGRITHPFNSKAGKEQTIDE